MESVQDAMESTTRHHLKLTPLAVPLACHHEGPYTLALGRLRCQRCGQVGLLMVTDITVSQEWPGMRQVATLPSGHPAPFQENRVPLLGDRGCRGERGGR